MDTIARRPRKYRRIASHRRRAPSRLRARHLVIEIDRCEQQASPGRPAASFARRCSSTSSATAVGSVSSLCPTCRQHDVVLAESMRFGLSRSSNTDRLFNVRRRAATLVLANEASNVLRGGRRGNPAPTFRAPFDISGGQTPCALRLDVGSRRVNVVSRTASADSHFTTRCGTQSALRQS